MAASRDFTDLQPFTFTSGTFLLCSSSSSSFFSCFSACKPWRSGRDGGTWGAGAGASGSTPWETVSLCEEIALLLQMGQHSFQNTKRETTNRASPQKPTSTARRLTEMSTGNETWFRGGTLRGQRERLRVNRGEEREEEKTRRGWEMSTEEKDDGVKWRIERTDETNRKGQQQWKCRTHKEESNRQREKKEGNA